MAISRVASSAVDVGGAGTLGDENIASWTDFTERTTFHGVRYIFEKSELRFRRPIWILVVVAALFAFFSQVLNQIDYYLAYNTAVYVGVVPNDSLEFPAITICNQNRYRITGVVEHGLYNVIDEIYKRNNISEVPWESFRDNVSGIDYGEFTRKTGHQKHLFIDSCTWNGMDCDIDNDFQDVLTDFGLCYTFKGQENSTVYIGDAGAGSGLKLVINVEQYEYMRGPQTDAGVMIMMHSRKETPAMQEGGFAAAPGTHTLVAMNRVQVTTLPPPYDSCHPDNPQISQCHAKCRARNITENCKCQMESIKMINENKTIPYCDLEMALSCVRQTLAAMIKSPVKCVCKPPCKQVRYDHQLSYAQLSKFNIDRMILDNPEKQEKLQETYFKALEVIQRYRHEIRDKDTDDMTKFVTTAERLPSLLQNISKHMTNPLATARYYNLPAIIDNEALKKDVWMIHDKFEKLMNKEIHTVGLDNNIKIIVNDFLEWDGSMSRFNQFLSDCLDGAATAQQNASSDGSVDLHSDLTNKTTMTYVSPECKNTIQEKVMLMSDNEFSFHPSFKLSNDLQTKAANYQKIIAMFFENSTKSPDAFDSHRACLHVLGLRDEVEETFSELYNYTQSFKEAQTLDNYISITNNIINITVKGFIDAVATNLSLCNWMALMVRRDFYNNLDIYSAYRHNVRLMNTFDKISKFMVSTAKKFESLVQPIIENINSYRKREITKMDMSIYMLSALTTNATRDLAAYESDVYTVIKSLQEKWSQLKYSLEPLYVSIGQSHLPLLTVKQIQNLAFFKLIQATNRSEFQSLIDGFSEDTTDNLQELLDLVFDKYDGEFQTILDTIVGPFKEISDILAKLRDDLREYKVSGSMNVNFFMENFLRLDIFYKDMSYTMIAQHEAFSLSSLVSEVGGFLGLLLGASLITVCELLDYLLLKVVRPCGRRQQSEPNVVSADRYETHL